jgi:hypothetical protein
MKEQMYDVSYTIYSVTCMAVTFSITKLSYSSNVVSFAPASNYNFRAAEAF